LPHPAADLRSPAFTRDFAECQLEIVTRPWPSGRLALAELGWLTAKGEAALGRELLWPFSMPPRLPPDAEIPIADLGPGEDARRAVLYRRGLALRYGKARQMICGVHVNVSLGPSLLDWLAREAPLGTEERGGTGRARDGHFLRTARNLLADLPLLILLFGASPVRGGEIESGGPVALSFRNSRLGYAGEEFWPFLSFESVPSYLAGIRRGLRTESAAFARQGLVRGGRVFQLNAHVFQADKEFYAPIRLRQTLQEGESTVQALARRGVGYLELRFLDVDPFELAGIAASTLDLLHLFVLEAASRPSLPGTGGDIPASLQEASEIALADPGRLEPALGGPLARLARRLSALEIWAERLDRAAASDRFRASLDLFLARIADPSALPSARLARRFAASGQDWTTFGVRTALALKQGERHAVEYARV